MAVTTNFVITLLDVAQQSKEAGINAALQVLDDGAFIRRGTLAARPAAGRAGRLYWATDAGNEGWYRDNGVTWDSFAAQHLNFSGGSAPTPTAGANAGTSPPAPVLDAGSNDQRGGLTWGTGTGPAAGAQAVVTYASAYVGTVVVLIVPRNAATVNLGLYMTSALGALTINTASAPTASQPNTTYSAKYFVCS